MTHEHDALGYLCAPHLHKITSSAIAFLDATHQVVHMISTPYALATKMDKTLELVTNGLTISHDDVINYRKNVEVYKPNSFDLLTSHAVDLYLCYIASLLSEIFGRKREMLKSSKSLSVTEIIELDSYKDIIKTILEKEISTLVQKGFKEMHYELEKKYDFALSSNQDEFKLLLDAISFRNVYVHNYGKADAKYLKRINSETFKIGDVIHAPGLDWVKTIVGAVVDLDNRAVGKFNLPIIEKAEFSRNCHLLGKLE